MSYIQDTMQCFDCQKYFNVATGSFGSGLPTECPYCKVLFSKDEYGVSNMSHASSGWNADNDGNWKKDILNWKDNPLDENV